MPVAFSIKLPTAHKLRPRFVSSNINGPYAAKLLRTGHGTMTKTLVPNIIHTLLSSSTAKIDFKNNLIFLLETTKQFVVCRHNEQTEYQTMKSSGKY